MTAPTAHPHSGVDRSYADVVERLFAELGSRVPLPVITAVVREGRAQLSCSPEAAMPERLEHLARQRLTPHADPVEQSGRGGGPNRSPARAPPRRCTHDRGEHGPAAPQTRAGSWST